MKHIFFSLLLFAGLSAAAQLRPIPGVVTDAFHKKYPNASGVEWKNRLASFQATYKQDGVTQIARFNGKGEWEQTEQPMVYDSLPAPVMANYKKGHYNDWDVKEVTLVWKNDGSKLYQVLVRKSAVQKKYLFYNDSGELVREALTI